MAVIEIRPLRPDGRFAVCGRCGLRRWLVDRVTERWTDGTRAQLRIRDLCIPCSNDVRRSVAEFAG